MINTFKQAEVVQRRRREAGLKGRSKAVRRWFTRNHGVSIEACIGTYLCTNSGELCAFHTNMLHGDFAGCGQHFHSLRLKRKELRT